MRQPAVVWAFLLGNWVIGAGVMLVPGMLDVLAADLAVTVPKAGSLIGWAAVVMCVGAPSLASFTSHIDRRALLAGSLVGYGLLHMLCALAPSFAVLLPLRVLAVVAAAIFTPQAAATLGLVLPPERRAAGITFIFLGWSLASVLALPMAAWLAVRLGWRPTFVGFGVLSVAGAWVVARATPVGVRAVPLPWSAWVAVAKHPALLGLLAVTAASATGQFTTWAYIAPFTRNLLKPSPEVFGLLLSGIGVAGVAGNLLASRNASRPVEHRGGAAWNVHLATAGMALGLGMLALGAHTWGGYLLGSLLWGLGVFAANSSQQARLQLAAPALAGASIALNTSMIYLGQATGSFIGAQVIGQAGYAPLPIVGAVLLVVALALSVRAHGRSG